VSQGGGRIAADPRDPQGRHTLERVFQIDVEPAAPFGLEGLYGQRVYLRFDLLPEPLAQQWYGGLRRLFLAHFSV
jgi:putative peptide zinc metalloprotease protein